MMTSVKRTNPFAQYAHQPAPLAKRLKKVESLARSNKPELKSKIFFVPGSTAAGSVSVLELTAISQGDNVSAREGNKIKIQRVELRGNFNENVDIFLIQSYGSFVPTFGSFSSSTSGCFILPDNLNTKLKQLAYYRNTVQGLTQPFLWKSTKMNLTVCYDGSVSTNCTRNRLHLVIVNSTAGALFQNAQVCVYFTDS